MPSTPRHSAMRAAALGGAQGGAARGKRLRQRAGRGGAAPARESAEAVPDPRSQFPIPHSLRSGSGSRSPTENQLKAAFSLRGRLIARSQNHLGWNLKIIESNLGLITTMSTPPWHQVLHPSLPRCLFSE